MTRVVDHGILRSVYFTDPHGIALEASWWVTDPTGRPADPENQAIFLDPDPVVSVEAIRDGTLHDYPHTELV